MAIALIFFIIIVSTFIALYRPHKVLFAAVFFLPWAGLDVDIGLRLTAYLVLIAPLFAVTIFRTVLMPPLRLHLGAFWLIVIYAVVWSAGLLPFLPAENVAGGGLRQPAVRGIFQILMFLITISPIWLVPTYIRNREGLLKMGKFYLASVAVLASIGWLQLTVWIVTGSDPFPIGYFNNLMGGSLVERSGMFNYMDATVYRMSSFAGEPKGLGSSIAVALILIQAGIKLKGRWDRWLWPFLFLSMVATFSTMALLGWLGATAVQFFTSSQGRLAMTNSVPTKSQIKSFFFWLAPVGLIAAVATTSLPVFDLIQMRTTERIYESDRGALEDFNVAVLDFLLDHPEWAVSGTGLGNVHLYAGSYLPTYAVRYAGETSFVAKSGALRWVSEIGLVTFIGFIVWSLRTISKNVRIAQSLPEYRSLAGIIGKTALPLMALWFVSGYISLHFFMMIGACITLGLGIDWRVGSDRKRR